MCIICESEMAGDRFLAAFKQSREAMEKASVAMLAASMAAATPEGKRRYDRTHKAMVRLMREWNSLEASREQNNVD